MARNIEVIQDEILAAKDTVATLAPLEVLTTAERSVNELTSTSKLSVWRQFVWAVAYAIFMFEQILDRVKTDVEERIAATRPHTKSWYREKALAFQYGHALVPETDYYDNSGLTIDEVESSKIVANAASVKTIISGAGALRLKTVRAVGDEWAPLTEAQLEALTDYMNTISDAGTTVLVTSDVADDVKMVIDAYYDPQVIGADGARLDGSDNEPVINAIRSFLKSIEFNGSLVLSKLEDEINSLHGFEVSQIRSAASKYAGYSYNDVTPQTGPITQIRSSYAGWMKLDEENTVINYIPYTEE